MIVSQMTMVLSKSINHSVSPWWGVVSSHPTGGGVVPSTFLILLREEVKIYEYYSKC
jgi:hypothetical protein